MEIQKEPLSTGPSEEPTTVAIPLTTQSPVTDRDAEQKPLMINDPNNNGIPERDRNTSQTKSHVCEECGKTFVTKASLKVCMLCMFGVGCYRTLNNKSSNTISNFIVLKTRSSSVQTFGEYLMTFKSAVNSRLKFKSTSY